MRSDVNIHAPARIDAICAALKLDFAELARRVAASISKGLAPAFVERLQRVAQDFTQRRPADQKLRERHRKGDTLLLAMRSWEFEAFTRFRRSGSGGSGSR